MPQNALSNMIEVLNSFLENCDFEKKCNPQLKVREYSNGSKHLHYQCDECGKIYGKPVSKSGINLQSIPDIDKAKLSDYEDRLRQSDISLIQQFQLIKKQLQEQSKNRKIHFYNQFGFNYSSFEEGYEHYLNSEFWADKRSKILLRDNYLCRICDQNRATQVHHISYRNLFNESDLELLSVCHPCHQQIHNKTESNDEILGFLD